MRITERELEYLSLNSVGFLAQKRLARGVLLNYNESVALITSQVFDTA